MNRVFAYLSILLVAGLISPIAVFSAASAKESEPAFFSCSSEQEVEEGIVADQALASDPSSYTNIANTFDHTYSGYLFMYNGPTYFRIVTTDVEVIDLNYSGIDCSLRLYKSGHCTDSDAAMRIASLNSSDQILVLDAGTTYFLALSTSIPGSHYYIENGTPIRKAYHFGTLSGLNCDYSDVPWEFICSFYCKNTHFLVNLYHYLEGTGNETSF